MRLCCIRETFSSRAVRLISLCVLLLSCTLGPRDVAAQEMELPVSIQVPLFLKVISFDRLRNKLPDTSLVVGVAYQSGFRSSATTRDEVDAALKVAADRRIRVVMIDLDRDDLGEVLRHQRITILYVAPLRGYSIASIAAAGANAHTITITGVPQYVEQGLAVGARLQGQRPKLMVNLPASRRCGANFTAELLKLAQVIE